MNKILTLTLAAFLTLGSLHAEAAKRLGGGKSVGQQSSQVTQRQAAPAAPAAPAQQAAPQQAAPKPAAPAPTAAQPQRKPWGAMLGGLAAGLGLAWLAHSLGFGEAFGQVLLFMLIGLVVLAVVGMFLRRRAASQGGLAYQGAAAGASGNETLRSYNPEKVGNDASARPWESQQTAFEAPASATAGGSMIGTALRQPGQSGWGIPEGFDVQGFVSAAKQHFITLQDAWDRADIETLRSMMTDTMVQEIRAQLQERETQFPGQPNKTEVVMLEAQLLGIEELPDVYMASVEFNGMIREEPSAGPSPFREVWNMTKPRTGGSGWLVAGVQALQ
ncbi:MAG: hypothetical protein RIQ38_1926 [Pseudomonadota bacterium]